MQALPHNPRLPLSPMSLWAPRLDAASRIGSLQYRPSVSARSAVPRRAVFASAEPQKKGKKKGDTPNSMTAYRCWSGRRLDRKGACTTAAAFAVATACPALLLRSSPPPPQAALQGRRLAARRGGGSLPRLPPLHLWRWSGRRRPGHTLWPAAADWRLGRCGWGHQIGGRSAAGLWHQRRLVCGAGVPGAA